MHVRRTVRTLSRRLLAAAAALTAAAGLAGAATAATGSLYAVDITHPASGVWLGSHLWLSDNLYRFCRLDPSAATVDLFGMPKPTGVALPNQSSAATCPYGSTGVAVKPGQPDYDPLSGYVYVPDRSSKNSVGVARYAYDPATETMSGFGPLVFGDRGGQVLAPTQGLGGLRPDAVALGPDGNLYVGSLNTGDIKRINAPAGPVAAQTVQTIGKSSKGGRVFGLRFIGPDLYLAEKNGLTVIRNATSPSCTGGCQAVLLPNASTVETNALASNGVDTLYYVQAGAVLRYSIPAAQSVVYATTGVLTPDQVPTGFARWYVGDCIGTMCSFAFQPGNPASLTLDAQGNLFVGDDPDTTDSSLYGRVWEIPAGSAPGA